MCTHTNTHAHICMYTWRQREGETQKVKMEKILKGSKIKVKICKWSRKSSNFQDIMPCSLVKVNWCFSGTHCLHLQSWRGSQARKHHQQTAIRASFLLDLLFNSEDGGNMFHPITWHYIQEDRTPHSCCCKNLKSSLEENYSNRKLIFTLIKKVRKRRN
jgi:hypothetical protein